VSEKKISWLFQASADGEKMHEGEMRGSRKWDNDGSYMTMTSG
jgi:hypothetical protein